MLNILNKINGPKDLKSLTGNELTELSNEIREVLIKKRAIFKMNLLIHFHITLF